MQEDQPQPFQPRPGIPIPLHELRVVPILLVLNIVIFAVQGLFSGPANVIVAFILTLLNNSIDACTLLFFGAKFNLGIQQGEYWRLVTAMFLHVNMIHLAFNQFALWIFGREVEKLFGSVRFLLIYMLSGLLASIASMLLNTSLSAGASGAIFGIIGTQLAFLVRNRDRFGEMGRQQIISLLAIIGINIVFGITVPGIDNWNHMGGLASGVLLGLFLSPRYDIERDVSTLSARVVDVNPLSRTVWAVLIVAAIVVASVPALANYAPTSDRDRILVRYCEANGMGGLGQLLR